MAIYSRSGAEVKIVRPVTTLDEVAKLENREHTTSNALHTDNTALFGILMMAAK